ncbi:hypothetical protein XELAEV_18006045mg [Xenopus laevis]|uniref:P2X purinoreceptor 7 intracellular domain-containing protein n=1 Tax=Xenopus laevis TaxID=8355 RepID=A0A974I3U2_XENLA|nr:hypothetical protein XELAEV_18006045mg [Xenopus laevis]
MQARACSQNHGPSFPFNPRRAQRTTSTQNPIEENDPLIRVGNINWCTCKNCIVMPTKMESICCRENRNTLSLIPEGGQCVTENEEFTSRCLKKSEIDFIFRVLGTVTRSHTNDPEYNRNLRKMAYRCFTVLAHGYLGAGIRRPIPACAVNAI